MELERIHQKIINFKEKVKILQQKNQKIYEQLKYYEKREKMEHKIEYGMIKELTTIPLLPISPTLTFHEKISKMINKSLIQYWTNLLIIEFETLIVQITYFFKKRNIRGNFVFSLCLSYTLQTTMFLILL
jgi:hypothetical protein